jgi:hypothetical protein
VAAICCGLPVATVPALSVAETVKLALSGPPLVNPLVEALTTKGIDWPLALILFVGKLTDSQEVLGLLGVRVKGHAQLPVPVINNV